MLVVYRAALGKRVQ